MHANTHKRLPRLLKKALRDRVVEGMRRKIADIVAELVAGLPADGPVDFCGAFADPLPARVLEPRESDGCAILLQATDADGNPGAIFGATMVTAD